jgi:hypothetical protein
MRYISYTLTLPVTSAVDKKAIRGTKKVSKRYKINRICNQKGHWTYMNGLRANNSLDVALLFLEEEVVA